MRLFLFVKVRPLPPAFAVEGEHVVVVVRQLWSVRHGEDGDAELFALLIYLALDINRYCARAFVLVWRTVRPCFSYICEVVGIITRIPKAGRWKKRRAMATLCFSPPLSTSNLITNNTLRKIT